MSRSSFLKFFPVPKYLQFPAVGFDVSDGSVKYIELLNGAGKVTVGKFGKKNYGEDLVGTLSAIQKQHGFGMVCVSIPEEESYFVHIKLPFIKLDEVRGAIELQIEEYVPYSANEVEFDYEILKTDPRPNGYIDVNVAVLPKKIVSKYLDIFRAASLIPISVMIEAEATSRAAVPADSKEVVMVVNVGKINTILSIVVRGSVRFSYTFKFGGDFIVRHMRETCLLNDEDAEKIKNERGMVDSRENQYIFECLLPIVSSIRDDISKHCEYWSDHKSEFLKGEDFGDISKLIVCGSQSIIPGFIEYLSVTLGIRTILADTWVNVLKFDEYVPPIGRNDSLEYATAVGLALSSLR